MRNRILKLVIKQVAGGILIKKSDQTIGFFFASIFRNYEL